VVKGDAVVVDLPGWCCASAREMPLGSACESLLTAMASLPPPNPDTHHAPPDRQRLLDGVPAHISPDMSTAQAPALRAAETPGIRRQWARSRREGASGRTRVDLRSEFSAASPAAGDDEGERDCGCTVECGAREP
jgi:hypothetical protein